MTLTPTLILAVLGVIFVAMLLRAVFGFGDAMFAIPLLAALIGLDRGAPVLALSGTVLAVLLLRERPEIVEKRTVLRMLLGALLGIPVGLFVLVGLPELWARRGLGALLIGFALWRLLASPPASTASGEDGKGEGEPGEAPARTPFAALVDVTFGALTGATTAAFDIAGPPLLAYSVARAWPSEVLRINFQALFLPLGVLVLAGHASAGLWTREVLLLAAMALPVMLAAYALGPRARARLHGRFGEQGGQRLLLTMILALGVATLLRP